MGRQFLHPGLGFSEHEDPTVDAWVHVSPVAELGVHHDPEVLLLDRDDFHFDPEVGAGSQRLVSQPVQGLAGSPHRPPLIIAAKTGREIEAIDLDALLHEHSGRQRGIQSSGDQTQRSDWLGSQHTRLPLFFVT